MQKQDLTFISPFPSMHIPELRPLRQKSMLGQTQISGFALNLCWTPDSGVTVQHHQAKWCWPPRFVQNTCSDWQYWARWWIGAPLNRQACIYWDVMWSLLRFHDSKIFHLTKVSQLRSFLWKGLFTWKLYFQLKLNTALLSHCPSVRPSQAWHLTFLTYIKA